MKRITLFLVVAAAAASLSSLWPARWAGGGSGLSDLRSHHSLWIPRVEFDLRDSGRRQVRPVARPTRQRDSDQGLSSEGTLPFPDGAVIVALHWTRVPSEDNNKVLAGPFPGAFVVGSPVNMQVMVKDSKKYAASGGWGFADFTDGKPGDEAKHKTCFPCHEPAKDRDFVFTRYAP